ncbi:hypothetical protein R6L94_02220 [Staphylococcus aureus]
MKKIFASLGVILLVAILGVAVVFAYGSYKDLELKKEEAKLEDKKNKKIDKNKTTENENQDQINNQTITAPNEKAQYGNNLGVQEKVRIKMILMVCLDLIQTEMDLSPLVK